jgi:hypothetical protein
MFTSCVLPADAAGEPGRAAAERDELSGAAAGIPAVPKAVRGEAFRGEGYLAVASGTITDEQIRAFIDEQEGEALHDDSRFPIDS